MCLLGEHQNLERRGKRFDNLPNRRVTVGDAGFAQTVGTTAETLIWAGAPAAVGAALRVTDLADFLCKKRNKKRLSKRHYFFELYLYFLLLQSRSQGHTQCLKTDTFTVTQTHFAPSGFSGSQNVTSWRGEERTTEQRKSGEKEQGEKVKESRLFSARPWESDF